MFLFEFEIFWIIGICRIYWFGIMYREHSSTLELGKWNVELLLINRRNYFRFFGMYVYCNHRRKVFICIWFIWPIYWCSDSDPGTGSSSGTCCTSFLLRVLLEAREFLNIVIISEFTKFGFIVTFYTIKSRLLSITYIYLEFLRRSSKASAGSSSESKSCECTDAGLDAICRCSTFFSSESRPIGLSLLK